MSYFKVIIEAFTSDLKLPIWLWCANCYRKLRCGGELLTIRELKGIYLTHLGLGSGHRAEPENSCTPALTVLSLLVQRFDEPLKFRRHWARTR
jgi:hypothetical protein